MKSRYYGFICANLIVNVPATTSWVRYGMRNGVYEAPTNPYYPNKLFTSSRRYGNQQIVLIVSFHCLQGPSYHVRTYARAYNLFLLLSINIDIICRNNIKLSIHLEICSFFNNFIKFWVLTFITTVYSCLQKHSQRAQK